MTAEEAKIPIRTLIALKRYKDHHIKPGGFLTALLEDRLYRTILQADESNFSAIKDILIWCTNELIGNSWGSPERVQRWIERRPCPSCDGLPTLIPCPDYELHTSMGEKQMGDYKL